MANHRKTDPVGIDVVVDRLQEILYDGLIDWDTLPLTYESYPRVYKNPIQGGDRPEWFIGDRDYQEVLLNDNKTVTSFWVAEDTKEYDDEFWNTQLSVIFQVNLKELFPDTDFRYDEEVHKRVLSLLNENVFDHEVTGLLTGVPNVYSEFNFSQSIFDDMNEFHVFRIDMNIQFEYGCK